MNPLAAVAFFFAVIALIGTAAYPGRETWGAVVVFAAIGALIVLIDKVRQK